MDITNIFQAIIECNDNTPSTTLKAIKNGEDVNIVSETGESFLHVIAKRYSGEHDVPYLLPVLFQLSNAGIKTNVKNQDGETALHLAVKKTRMQILVRALIMIGVDPKIQNTNGEEIKDLIDEVERGTQICVDLLYPGLWNAVDKGDDDLVLRLVNSWCNLEEIKNGKPLLNLVHLNLIEKTANMIEKSSKTMKLVYASLAKDKKR
ncbi:unnamed protein product [Mytilus edulis]|uniref:Uncharacterized protein n=1 Tax=Mytilus edulis TaxID=6550 RepID=A0A8S3TC65_MYTED|nr:unnamed protein product [Mytilus edulis]